MKSSETSPSRRVRNLSSKVSRAGGLFTPFYTTKDTGTGLGLAYCRRAVEVHGGTITVKSVVDEGTSFTISIPRSDGENQ